MKAGEVVHIRISPRDAVSCIDVLKAAGILSQGMSFAQAIKIALAILLNTARKQGIVPDRTGFEFEEVMGQFKAAHARKVAITTTFDSLGSELEVPALNVVAPAGVERLRRQLAELKGKKGVDPLNWVPEDQAQLEDVAFKLSEMGEL